MEEGQRETMQEEGRGDCGGRRTRALRPRLILWGLYAQSAVLADGLTGRVLYGKGEDTIRPHGQHHKDHDCILALRDGKSEDVVTASPKAGGQPKVHLGVRSGRPFI